MCVDIELAAVDVEKSFLIGNEPVAHVEGMLGRRSIEWGGLGLAQVRSAIDASAGDYLSVDIELAAVDVEQGLLVNDQTVALFNALQEYLVIVIVSTLSARYRGAEGQNQQTRCHRGCDCSAITHIGNL